MVIIGLLCDRIKRVETQCISVIVEHHLYIDTFRFFPEFFHQVLKTVLKTEPSVILVYRLKLQ